MVYGMKLKKAIKIPGLLSLIFLLCLVSCQTKETKPTIKFSTWGSETEINIIKPVIKQFEKEHPGIKVELMHIPQSYFQKLHMLVAANLTPDVIFINNLNLPVYASGNILMDLDKQLTQSQSLQKTDFFPESLRTMTYNKKLLAIPRDISNVVIYYNKDLFKKYGVNYPDENWTMKDFLETAKKLTRDNNNDGKIDIFGISFDTKAIFVLPFVWSEGGKLFNENNTNFALAEKNSCESLQFYADLRNLYHVAPKASESGNNTMAQLFMQQKIAMYISGRWSVPRFREDITFNWDIARFPSGHAGSIVGIDGSGWAISSDTKYPEEAWIFIEYLASKTTIKEFSRTGLIVPSRKDIAYSIDFIEKTKKPEHAQIFLNILNNARPTPQVERWNEINDLIDKAMEPVWNGNNTACKALKSIENDVNKLLE